MNVLLINPTPAGDDVFATRRDHQLAMIEHSLDGDITNFEDAVNDPTNLDELKKRYSEFCKMHARMGLALHRIWRAR